MLKEQIQQDLKASLKGGKQVEVSVLRMIIAAINNRETEKRTKIWKEKPESKIEALEKESKLTDEEVLEVLFFEVKKRKEACVEYEKGERTDLIEQEKKEIEIIQKYLPEQLSEEEVAEIAREVIKAVGANDSKDAGRVMSQLMPQLKGRADGGLASRVVRELLNQ